MTVPAKFEVLICSDEVKSYCGSLGSSVIAKDLLISRTPAIGEERASLVPGTLDVNGECRDPLLDLKSTILTRPIKLDQLDSARDISGEDDSPHTPKEDVFDPFAPGSEDLLRAPQCKKRLDEWRISVARRLNFGSSTEKPGKRPHGGNGTHMSDEEMVEHVYKNLLETILENRIADILAEMSSMEWADEDCKTPTSGPKLNGIAETCPGPPMKAAAKSRNIDLSLCRKLQF
ncbi:hypothetical protein CDL15_Pgr007623 [Punica granatum]|nr:hypothetical protein CDL15_Pgr007623 [Punica granatum]PKI41003.1 hypothetical protein CRG98_038531 [Punica granatum]